MSVTLETPQLVQQERPARDAVPPQSSRIPEIDGLRGLAILLVVVYHYFGSAGTETGNNVASYLRAAAGLGWSGVDLFFILSGFLIGGILLDACESPRYFKAFYLRRVHRILPIYYVFVLVYAGLAFGVGRYLPGMLRLEAPGAAFFLIYLLFLQNFGSPLPAGGFGFHYLSPLWSLAVEEQFYLAAPLMIRYLSRRTLIRVLLALMVAAPALRVLLARAGDPVAMFHLTPARADALSAGVLLAIAWRSPGARRWAANRVKALRAAWVALFALSILLFEMWPPSYFRVALGYSTLALFFALTLLLVLLRPEGYAGSVFRSRALRTCGTISYCWYLIHDPVGVACSWVFLRAGIPTGGAWQIATAALAIAAGLSIAGVSWRYFEKPLLRRGHAYRY